MRLEDSRSIAEDMCVGKAVGNVKNNIAELSVLCTG